MEKPNKKDNHIIIDYENLDVRDIMDQIKKKIAGQKEKPTPEMTAQGGGIPPSSWEPPEETGEMEGLKGRLKEFLLRGTRPFSPLIKLLVLPVHQEVREAHRNLHHAHKRLDNLERMSSRLEQRIDEVYQETRQGLDETRQGLDEIRQETRQNVDEVRQETRQNIDEVRHSTHQRLDEFSGQLEKTKEYVKLLHNLSHNMVVELSKMKIEEENMKIKNRILEKDFEFLGKKEKALERKIYK